MVTYKYPFLKKHQGLIQPEQRFKSVRSHRNDYEEYSEHDVKSGTKVIMSFVVQKIRVNTKQTRQYGGNLFYSKDRQNNVKYVGSDNMFIEKNNHTIIHCICKKLKKKLKF